MIEVEDLRPRDVRALSVVEVSNLAELTLITCSRPEHWPCPETNSIAERCEQPMVNTRNLEYWALQSKKEIEQ